MSLGEVPHRERDPNGAAFVLLLLGFVAIRHGDRRRHHALMLSACGASALFLVSYLTRIALTGTHRFLARGRLLRRVPRGAHGATRSSPRSPHRWCCGRSLALRDRVPAHRRIARDAADLDVRLGDGRGRRYVRLYHLAPSAPRRRAPAAAQASAPKSASAARTNRASGPAPTRGGAARAGAG